MTRQKKNTREHTRHKCDGKMSEHQAKIGDVCDQKMAGEVNPNDSTAAW